MILYLLTAAENITVLCSSFTAKNYRHETNPQHENVKNITVIMFVTNNDKSSETNLKHFNAPNQIII